MRRKRHSYKDSIVFGSIFEWNLHVKLSLVALFILSVIQVVTADPFTPKNITTEILTVIIITIFPIMMIWFAEHLEDLFNETSRNLPLEFIIRGFGWVTMVLILFTAIAQFWREN